MTNKEALQAELSVRVPLNTIEMNLRKQGVDPAAEYDPENDEDQRGIDLALAGLILFICLSPKSIKELDFMITNQDVKDLLLLRSGLLKKHGVDDEMSQEPTIESISDLW